MATSISGLDSRVSTLEVGGGGDFDGGHSFASNGYQKLTNGFIIQWGWYNGNAYVDNYPTFPIAFPNACLQVVGEATDGGNFSILAMSKTNFRYHDAAVAGGDMRWIAIGY